jgi:hypothetical protein
MQYLSFGKQNLIHKIENSHFRGSQNREQTICFVSMKKSLFVSKIRFKMNSYGEYRVI